MTKKKKVTTLVDVIANSEAAFVNKMSEAECMILARHIADWLETKAESAEHLFNIDEDEDDQVQAIPLSALGM